MNDFDGLLEDSDDEGVQVQGVDSFEFEPPQPAVTTAALHPEERKQAAPSP